MSNFKMDGSKGPVHLSGPKHGIEDWLCHYKEKLIFSGLTLLVVIGLGQVALKDETVDYEELTSVVSSHHNPDILMDDIMQNDIVKLVSYTDNNGSIKNVKVSYGTVINDSGTALSQGYNAVLTTKDSLRPDSKIKIYVNNRVLDADVKVITKSEGNDNLATISVTPKSQEAEEIYSKIQGISLAQNLPKHYSMDIPKDTIIAGTPILAQIDGEYQLIGMFGNNNKPVNLKAENSNVDIDIGSNGFGRLFNLAQAKTVPDIRNHVIYGLGKPGESATFARSSYKNAVMPINGLSYEISFNTPKNTMGYGL